MAADSNPGGFGGKLRDARERRGISLRQIADTTKISIAVLEGLERNDISHLPGGIFGRGFVRSYASAVGLDPESAIRDFIAQFPDNAAVTAGHPSVTQIDDNEALESNRRIATTALRILGLSLPVAGVVMYFGVTGRRAPTIRPSAPALMTSAAAATNGSLSSQSAAVPSDDMATPSTTAVDAAQSSTAPAGDRVAIGLAATSQVWVSATIDGKRVVNRELSPGEHEQFDMTRDLVLLVGNAGGLAVTFDGQEAKPLGRSGQTGALRLTLANYKEYLASQ